MMLACRYLCDAIFADFVDSFFQLDNLSVAKIVVFSERRSLCAIARPSVCLSVCLSVTFVLPTQPAEIFGNFSTPFGTLAIR